MDEDGDISDMEDSLDRVAVRQSEPEPFARASISTESNPHPQSTMEGLFPNLHGPIRHRAIQKAKRQAKRLLEGRERHTKVVSNNLVKRVAVTRLANNRAEAPHSQPGYVGLRAPTVPINSLEELLLEGYTYVPYEDG